MINTHSAVIYKLLGQSEFSMKHNWNYLLSILPKVYSRVFHSQKVICFILMASDVKILLPVHKRFDKNVNLEKQNKKSAKGTD